MDGGTQHTHATQRTHRAHVTHHTHRAHATHHTTCTRRTHTPPPPHDTTQHNTTRHNTTDRQTQNPTHKTKHITKSPHTNTRTITRTSTHEELMVLRVTVIQAFAPVHVRFLFPFVLMMMTRIGGRSADPRESTLIHSEDTNTKSKLTVSVGVVHL